MSNNLYNGLLAVLAGVCSVSYIFSGLYIFSPAVNDRRIRPLLYSCFFSSVWCCCYMMYYLSTGADMKDFWLRFMFAGMVAFVFPLWFFIKYIDFTANKKTIRFLSFAVWLPPLPYVYKSIYSNAVAIDFPDGFWFLYTQILTTVYNIGCMVLIFAYHAKYKNNKSRRQTIILITSAVILITVSWILDIYLGYSETKNIPAFWLLIWIGILTYTIKKYRFITIKPDFINRDISENIEEGIILLDPDFNIIFTNKAVGILTGLRDTSSLRIRDIFSEKYALDSALKELTKTDSVSGKLRINISGKENRFPADVRIKKIIDDYKDCTGFLLIISRVNDMGSLKKHFKLSGREVEVIHQLSVGRSNKEIADLLGINKRTIDTHVMNIYNKLGVNNRIEFLNKLSEFYPANRSD